MFSVQRNARASGATNAGEASGNTNIFSRGRLKHRFQHRLVNLPLVNGAAEQKAVHNVGNENHEHLFEIIESNGSYLTAS